MKISITARNFTTLNPDLLEYLRKTGAEVADYSDLNLGAEVDADRLCRLAGDADIVIVGVEPYTREVIGRCPNLKMISKNGVGYNNVDVDACRERGITLCCAVGTVEGTVAEQVMAYILFFARRLDLQSEHMHQGQWWRHQMPGVIGRTLGLVGFGNIGKEIARRAAPFGMEILYYCRHPRPEWEEQYHARWVSLDELLGSSDYISINIPLNRETENMFDYETIRKIKSGGVLINIARGGVLVEEDLKRALDEGHLSGAGVDVYSKEPCTDSPLISCPNAVLTPHTAGFLRETFRRQGQATAKNVADFMRGQVEEKNRII